MPLGLLSRRRALRLGLAALPCMTAPVWADAPSPLSAGDRELIDQATNYLQNLGEVKGRFEQTDSRGAVSSGQLFLKRPGRARFVYDPPSSLLVICDGYTVMVADPRLKTANRYPLGMTPLALLLAKQVRLDKGVTVSAVDRFADGYALTAYATRHPAQGRISLMFSQNPLQLQQWRMTDGQGRTTQVRLTGLEPAPGLDPALFVVPAAPPRGGAEQF